MCRPRPHSCSTTYSTSALTASLRVPPCLSGVRARMRRSSCAEAKRPAAEWSSSGRQRQVRVLGRTPLEGQDGGILDDTVADLDGSTNGVVRVPGGASCHDGGKEGEERLADLPGRGVPQVGRAVVDGVVEHVVTDQEGRVGER